MERSWSTTWAGERWILPLRKCGGKVNLIAHGGIAMCGGRDFDRTLVDNVVKPWLRENFKLPEELLQKQNNRLMRMAAWAAEKAKMELSANEEATITLSEMELNVRDQEDAEVYLDIPITRKRYDALIDKRIRETVEAAREAIGKAGLRPEDDCQNCLYWGPTNYKAAAG